MQFRFRCYRNPLTGSFGNSRAMEVHQVADVFDALADTPAEAADLKARSDLLSALSDRVKAWKLPRSSAATRLGITPAWLDDALRGKLGRFSRDDREIASGRETYKGARRRWRRTENASSDNVCVTVYL
jgi:predicted XRE-type DNA-binding protein